MSTSFRRFREEPYRIFFPLGLMAGIWGVMMWPMLYAGWITFYPGEAHARMMIEGFLGAFIAGFLGTAFPRLSGNKIWFRGEFVFLVTLWLLCVASQARGRVAAGDAAFTGFLAVLFLGTVGRWIRGNSDTPPPGFLLAPIGIGGGMISAAILARTGHTIHVTGAARLFLLQGFPLLPLLGIAPYLLPRFFGHPSDHSFAESPSPPAGWWKQASASLAAGAGVIAGLYLETIGHAATGQILRATVVIVWFASETPLLRKARTPGTAGNATRWASAGLAAGLLCAAIWPDARVGSLHLFFISGLGLMTLAVATRVVLGHGGRHDLLVGKIRWVRWMVGLVVLGAFTRMTSDFVASVKVSHHIYAAWSWAIACGIWFGFLARHLLRTGGESSETGSNPTR